MAGLPLPPHFVGRKAELRGLRRALRDPHVTAAFVRGIGGMGKSALAAKLIERPGVELDGVLVIRCHEVRSARHPRQAGQLPGRAGRGRPRRGRRPAARQHEAPGRARPPGRGAGAGAAVSVRVRQLRERAEPLPPPLPWEGRGV